MAKSRCAREWGGWGRLSDDGPGQHNPDRSEGPWGRAGGSARTEVPNRASSLTQSREYNAVLYQTVITDPSLPVA